MYHQCLRFATLRSLAETLIHCCADRYFSRQVIQSDCCAVDVLVARARVKAYGQDVGESRGVHGVRCEDISAEVYVLHLKKEKLEKKRGI